MNIAIDIRCLQTPYPTGVSVYTRELLDALFKLDTTNAYYLFSNSCSAPPVCDWQGKNIHYLHSTWPNKLFNTAIATGLLPALDHWLIKKFSLPIKKFDIVFSPNLNFTRLSADTKSILTVHDLSFTLFPNFFSLKQQLWHAAINPERCVKRADHIIAVSEHTKRDVMSVYAIPEKKITVIYPGLPTLFCTRATPEQVATVRLKYHLPQTFILSVGAIEPRKNSASMIEAFEQTVSSSVHNKNSIAAHLVLVGPPGYTFSHIKNRIAASQVRDRIHHIGYIPEADKPALYRAATAFVYPSFYEGFGFPVLEALSQGTPVITSNRSSLPEVAATAAILINPHKPEEISRGLKSVLADQNSTADLREAGSKQVKNFNFANSAVTLLQLFTV